MVAKRASSERRNASLGTRMGKVGAPALGSDLTCESMDRAAVACGLTRLLEGVARRNVLSGIEKPSLVDPGLIFYSAYEPTGSLSVYVHRLMRYIACPVSVFIAALVYMDRLVKKGAHYRLNKLNVHRIFLSAVVVASKVLEDEPHSLRHFAMVGGVSVSELVALERAFLGALDFQLTLVPEVYSLYERRLRANVRPTHSRRHRKSR